MLDSPRHLEREQRNGSVLLGLDSVARYSAVNGGKRRSLMELIDCRVLARNHYKHHRIKYLHRQANKTVKLRTSRNSSPFFGTKTYVAFGISNFQKRFPFSGPSQSTNLKLAVPLLRSLNLHEKRASRSLPCLAIKVQSNLATVRIICARVRKKFGDEAELVPRFVRLLAMNQRLVFEIHLRAPSHDHPES